MTTPNEPGHPGPGDGPGNGGGSTDSAGQRPAARLGTGEVPPPWQRGPARPRPAAPRAPEPSAHQEPRPTGHSPGVDARLRRFISGTAAPGAQAAQPKPATDEPDPARSEGPPTDSYGSELPDLSGSAPHAAQRKSIAQRVQVSARPRGPVRASMQIRRIDPWSTLKVSLVLSVALFFVWMIAVAFLYLVLGGMGVWSKLNSNVGDLLTNTSGAGELVSSGSIFGFATLIGLVNIVVLTAMATLGAVIYNVSTDVVGGIEVTLADRD
ncbi:MAG TPA: DUF3566 domain-containing protein [Mycobacterium sp.]|nr:DUF3566 domain-containing protein [Mycobacterium sp.]